MDGPGDFDGCECISTHALAMRRLLSIIRQGQRQCTDTECIDLPGAIPTNSEASDFTMMTMFFLIAMILYFIRPSSFTRTNKDVQRPPGGGNGPNDDAPPAVN